MTPRTPAALAVLVWVTAFAAEPLRSTLEVSAPVAAAEDACLDHAVKELGMSAKRVDKERLWNIGPQFLHPAVVNGGTFRVEMRPGDAVTRVTVTASWPGALKEKATQAELEERLRAMVTKMTQLCGVVRPTLKCVVSDTGAAPVPCALR